MVTINLLFVITIVAGALALYDGIVRLRGRRGGGSIVAIAEIVFAGLMLVSYFVLLPSPFGFLTWTVLLEVALVVALVLGGKVRRGSFVITVIALILNAIVMLKALGWLSIPGLI